MKVRVFVIAMLLLTGGTALAQDDDASWESLTESQREVLAPYADNWSSLEAERRARLAQGAKRWSQMDAEDRSAARERFQTWNGLSDDQRDSDPGAISTVPKSSAAR